MICASRVSSLLNYNAETGVFRWAVNRSGPAKAGTVAGRLESRGYRQISIDGRRYMAHRLAWLVSHGVWPREEIDHVNGNRDDNSLSNLRAVSHAQNMRNKRRYQNGRSPHVGVRPTKHGTWVACIGGGHIGSFKSVDAAVLARRDAEIANGYHPNHGRV